ncbi:unnamed protein product [Spodoptera littoralis]|uniref:Cyclic nucleotide-binding domain-containing protein n=1 Tax=Spodoptera littoralis TaxID=7109 RepID=A0A9P0N3A1_SPOLI|nr:unnamed protein product [Spodoptera littoralis]CAH1640012.1 unnamed protein product [Spodoptera littoralis]
MYGDGKHVCTISQTPECADVPPTANFFQRQRCVVRGLVLPSARHHGAALFIRSLQRLHKERARHASCVWHPYSPIKYYWDCMQLFFVFAVFLYMPVQVFIKCPNYYDPFILFTDALAFLNVCSLFVTGYLEHEHKIIILDPKMIAINYLKTNFITDFIGCLPLQLIEPFSECEYPTHTIMFLFKLLRCTSLKAQWKNVIGQLQLTYINYVALKIFVMLIMFFHWMTYIHYQVPILCYHLYEKTDAFIAWLKRFHIMTRAGGGYSIFEKYSTNFYLVCGLCIGAGYYTPLDTHFVPELLLSSGMGLLGLLFLTYAFSALLRLAIYHQFETYCFSGKSRELEEYMVFMRLPKYLKRKIRLFINYKFNEHFFHEEAIKNTINEQIRQDINMHCCQRLVMNVPMFQDMPVALINSIIFSLKQVLYMPGQKVVEVNKPGESIHLISSGTVAVMDATGREVAHLRDGAFFGENALLSPGILRTATIIALEITEIYNLDSASFMACLQPYPHLKRRMDDVASRRPARHARPRHKPPKN